MPFVQWNESYSVHNKELDAQHKRLFAMMNRLHEAMSVGEANKMVGKLLVELGDYAKHHCAAEEEKLEHAGYPRLAQHRREHVVLAKQIAELAEQHRAGQVTVALRLMTYLQEWLQNHVLTNDQLYSEWLKRAGL